MGLARFDEIAAFFDQVTRTPLHRRMRASAVAALRPLSGRRVLDLGTGPGGLARDLAAGEARVIGLDGSPEMLRRAALQGAPGGHVHWLRADASRLPLRDRSVDAVTGMLVLHLLDDPVPGLAECRRVLRGRGRLAFVTQSDDFGPGAAARIRGPLSAMEEDFLEGCAGSAASHVRLDRDGWLAAFAAAGLPPPTITRAVPGVAWLLFTELPGEGATGEGHPEERTEIPEEL